MKKLICYRGRFNPPTRLDREDWALPFQYCSKPCYDPLYFVNIEKVEVTMPEMIEGQLTTLADVEISHYLKGKTKHRDYLPEYDQITVKVLEKL